MARKSLACDANERLIGMYNAIRDYPAMVSGHVETLREGCPRSGKPARGDFYRTIRAGFNRLDGTPTEMAAMFIFLNKLGFNGMYRENKRAGHFNVPLGSSGPGSLPDLETINAFSGVLADFEFHASDFTSTMVCAGKGDLLYLDPP